MEHGTLDAFLPGIAGYDDFDLSIDVQPGTPVEILLGIPDWLGRLAADRTVLRRVSFDAGLASPCIEIRRDRSLAGAARLFMAAQDRPRLAWGTAQAGQALARALGRLTGEMPRGVMEVSWNDGRLSVATTDGRTTITDVGDATGRGTVSRDLLSLLPGQDGAIGRIAVPKHTDEDFVLAFTAYSVRKAISALDPLPLPLLVGDDAPGAEAVLDTNARAAHIGAGGRLTLPGGTQGTALFAALAALPSYSERPIRQHRRASGARGGELLYEREWTVAWEGERVLSALSSALADRSEPPDAIEIFVSETKEIRDEIRGAIIRMLAQRGWECAHVAVRSAYKQGYHYAVEAFLPLLSGQDAAGIEIDVPTAQVGPQLLEHACSLVPSVAPADEVLRAQLGLDETAVQVRLGAGECFRFAALDSHGEVVHSAEFAPHLATFPMEGVYPGRTARVETGGFRILGPRGEIVCEEQVTTDAEAAMSALLTGFEEIKECIADRDGLPLFEELRATVVLSEPDEDLPAAFERFSPPEELHEEIYFGALAAFDPLTQRRMSGDLRAPGRIVPEVSIQPHSPTMIRLTLTKASAVLTPATPLPLQVTEVRCEDGEVVARAVAPTDGYQPLPENLPAGVGLDLPGYGILRPSPPSAPQAPPTAAYLPQEARDWTRAVAAGAGALAWTEERSYLGLPIPAAFWAPALATGTASPRKLSRRLPTLFVVAGHHANETSSTISALEFLSNLPLLGKEAAVLVVPMENPDGASLHRELAREHPGWKLHAARFNAVGHEFGRAGSDSPFGESLVRPRLLRDFDVDVLLDDHGVPAHEWAQPFSGRSSPPLFPLAYTYPSGIFYGIGSGSADGPDEQTRPYWLRVTDRLSAVPELAELEELLWRRYVRYGGALCPDRYPSRQHLGWPFQPMARATGRRAPARPLEFVTEVADEGAPPRLLRACVRSHLEANIAFLEVLASQRKIASP